MNAAEPSELAETVRRALGWSALSNITLRLGSLTFGIVLARLLSPEQFGVYAVALTVQAVLLTLADLGLASDLIRSDDPERRAPTVATLALCAGASLTAVTALGAGSVAAALGSAESARAIQVLSLTFLLAGVGVVPYAALYRDFRQRRIFVVALVDLAVGVSVTLVLLAAGWGVLALAVGRVTAQATALVLQFRLAGVRPAFGFDPIQSASAMRFGIPVAAANLLSWALLSVDAVVIARSLGATQLGYYVLAFNVSTWPMSALGMIVRSVALPGFARTARGTAELRDSSLADALGLTWVVALPAGAFIALLAPAVVSVLYGAGWSPAAGPLVALGLFGSMRVVFDLMSSYLLARGAARSTLVIQSCWFVAVVPAVVAGTQAAGISGAGWAHLAVALAVVLPLYLVAVHRCGAALLRLVPAFLVPMAAMVPAAATTLLVAGGLDAAYQDLVVGGLSGGLVYLVLVWHWVAPQVSRRGSDGVPERSAAMSSGRAA